ncbi:GNAT family N-acetyltransferase [Kitasatospora nipponensis]|uniref:GNAT family N-acetyltransferase n=1 Tax=Kitasatospora nipponensis TaxID=258049 RepID=A0ABP4H147_9ACTN
MSSTPIPATARPEVRIDPSDVGRRVSVRRIEGARDPATGRPVFRDAIGVLTSWDEHELTVATRDSEVRIAADRLVAGKVVPPFPVRPAEPRAVDPADLQRVAARGWPAVEQEALGDWTLRASAGFTRRANSVQTLGDPGLPLDRALEHVRQWYAARDLPAWLEVTSPGSPAGLVAELDRLGAAYDLTLVRTAPLAPLARAGRADAQRVRLARRADADWMSLYRRVGDDPVVARAAQRVLHGGPSVWFAAVHADPTLPADPTAPDHPTAPDRPRAAPLAIGRCVIDGPWACFGAVEVQPAARRRGLATAVMAALAARAAEEGAVGGYLQVEAENDGAITLYDGLGFTTSHTYHYARLPRA